MSEKNLKDYGYFDDANREFVITNPFPPAPWINYLSNGSLCTIISQKAGGMTFLESAAEMRFTRYNQSRSVPMDRPGQYVYIQEDDGTVWSPAFEPTRTRLDSWKCIHGLGYTTFKASFRSLHVSLTFFVHPKDNVLVWDMQIVNHRKKKVQLFICPYVEFSFLDMHEEVNYFHWCRMQNSFTYDRKRGAINYFYGPPHAKKRTNVFFAASRIPDSFDCDRDSFIGREGSLEKPSGLLKGKLTETELPGGIHGAGILGFKVMIPKSRSERLHFFLGSSDTMSGVHSLIRKVKTTSYVDKGFTSQKKFYSTWLNTFQADVPDTHMNRFINTWSPYNSRQAFERARFVSAVHTGMGGGMQSRDSIQDSMGLTPFTPGWVRDRLCTVARYQKISGRFIGTFDPKSLKGPVTEPVRCDNGVWSIFTAYGYIAETGDMQLLSEKIPYLEGKNASYFEHLWQGLQFMVDNAGKHGLPLLFDQDWNDSLRIFKEKGAESVMLAQQLVYACTLFAELSRSIARRKAEKWALSTKERLIKAVNSPAVWDGKWYRRLLYTGKRTPLGTAKRKEAKIYLNTQSWAVISGAAPEDRAQLCMNQADKYLSMPYGFKLLAPPYSGTPEPGDPLLGNRPGIGENAGIFNHANTWAIIATALLGEGDQAFERYRRCLPPAVIETVGIETYKNEPYAYSSHLITEPDPRAGNALLSWLSGTASWMYIAATQYILGIRPTLNGLIIDPCIPARWKGFTVQKKFRGAQLHIIISNPDTVQKGVTRIRINGKELPGAEKKGIPYSLISGKGPYTISVQMGKGF